MAEDRGGFGTGYNIFKRRQSNKNISICSTDVIYEPNSVKRALCELSEVKNWDSNEKKIKIEKNIIYSSIEHEIASFFKKVEVQYDNINCMCNVDFTWLFVTYYYWFFYISCVLTRFNNYFVIYLEEELAKEISQIASSYNESPVQINGNGTYFISITNDNSDENSVIVTLKTTRDQHKSNWIAFKKFLSDIKNNTTSYDERTFENIILKHTSKIFNVDSSVFSKARNYFNYRFEVMFDTYGDENELLQEITMEDIAKILVDIDESSIGYFNCSKPMKAISHYFYEFLKKLKQDL